MEPAVQRRRQGEIRSEGLPAEPARLQSAAEAARALERALAHFESVLGQLEERAERPAPEEEEEAEMEPQELSGLERTLREFARRLEDAVDHLGLEAQRLSDEASRLAQIAGQLEARLGDLAQTGARAPASHDVRPAPSAEPVAPREPQFRPAEGAIGVVLAAVPGFQGLMEVQRALSGLPATERASVVAYKNGEASLEVLLRAPVSAQQIVEELGAATGYRLLIEEARPEAQRLRLRFIEQEGQGFGVRAGDR